MNKITIEFDNITKTKTKQTFKMHSDLDTNVFSIAAAINAMVEELDSKFGHDILDAMIYLVKHDITKDLEDEFDEDVFGDCDNGD